MGAGRKVGKLIFHPKFRQTVDALNSLKIQLPPKIDGYNRDFQLLPYPKDGKLVSEIEKIGKYPLDAGEGLKVLQNGSVVCAYDESVQKYEALEGSAFLTAHALVLHNVEEYIPSTFVTFDFYTRAKVLTDQTDYIKHSKDPESDSKRDYILDRSEFLLNNVPENSILFIDGPLVGGQVTSYTTKLNKELMKKNIIPIFFVKNTSSNLVVNNLDQVHDDYNSYLHWANSTLKEGERTNFFFYADQYSREKAKAFCYIRGVKASPQRVEMHTTTFQKHKDIIPQLMDLVYYLILLQGEPKNPQIRSIAIAEKYATEAIKLINFRDLVMNTRLQATINQDRFAW